MISFDLDEEQRLIVDTVRGFAAERLRPRLRELELGGEVPDDLRRAFEELGLALLDVPEALGGAGQSQVTAALAHEELSFGDPGAAVALARAQPAACALAELADDAQRIRLLAALARPGTFGAVALSEPGRAQGPLFATRARRDGNSWILSGRKSWVLFGDRAALTVVFALVDGEPDGWAGAGAFVVEGRAGVTAAARHTTLGLNAAPIAEIALEGCRVPSANRLLGGGDLEAATRRVMARVALLGAARQVGLARAAFEYALRYAEERKAFGKPIAHFQEIAFFLADMHMEVESARWLLWRAARALDTGDAAFSIHAAKAAAHANEAAWFCADRGVQILGGAGYMRDHPSEKWMRDTKTLALFGASTEAHAQAIAAAELGQCAPAPLEPRLQAAVL